MNQEIETIAADGSRGNACKEFDEEKVILSAEEVEKSRVYLIMKRLLDIAASALALVVLSPLFLIISLIIVIDDPHGSPFYSQERIGINGKIFKFWKFRSMVVNADQMLEKLQAQNEKDGPVFKMKDDPRITRIGKFIRKSSIDELPQLWNVLKGDMSLVGPRPALPKEVERYNDYQRQRLLVTPGLTCYWQASDGRDKIGFDEWVDMDVQYIKDRSFWLDIKLILRTVKVVFTGQGQ
ncbi:MAG: sugar transferase [Clostridia bacterium]